MREIQFQNRTEKSFRLAYMSLKNRYRKVKFVFTNIHGLFSGYFIVSSYKKYNYA
jgi:hypothetical protein